MLSFFSGEGGGEQKRTAREEAVFGEDGDCVDEEDADCLFAYAVLLVVATTGSAPRPTFIFSGVVRNLP